MGGLADSRHAPKPYAPRASAPGLKAGYLAVTPAPAISRRPHGLTAAQELQRYTQIVRRLQWKLPFLAHGYRCAIDRVGRDAAGVAEAELMFKLDFFEFYMLIERALVHLLGVLGIAVPRDGRVTGAGGGRDTSATHRYHANVLAALDNPRNPLHAVLGTGEVHRQLGRAKDLRNRWKSAVDDGTGSGVDSYGRRYAAPPLESYNLERMLETVFHGFDQAFRVAQRFVRGEWDWDTDMGDVAVDWTATEEDQWDFMMDAMEWEAV